MSGNKGENWVVCTKHWCRFARQNHLNVCWECFLWEVYQRLQASDLPEAQQRKYYKDHRMLALLGCHSDFFYVQLHGDPGGSSFVCCNYLFTKLLNWMRRNEFKYWYADDAWAERPSDAASCRFAPSTILSELQHHIHWKKLFFSVLQPDLFVFHVPSASENCNVLYFHQLPTRLRPNLPSLHHLISLSDTCVELSFQLYKPLKMHTFFFSDQACTAGVWLMHLSSSIFTSVSKICPCCCKLHWNQTVAMTLAQTRTTNYF